MTRIDRNKERIYLMDREELARAVGHLLGCHAYHEMYLMPAELSMILDISALPCLTDARVSYRLTLGEEGPGWR